VSSPEFAQRPNPANSPDAGSSSPASGHPLNGGFPW
jgi:hypothetical protein